MKVKTFKIVELERITNALVEDILSASDEEILAEAKEDYDDPAEARALYKKALIEVAR